MHKKTPSPVIHKLEKKDFFYAGITFFIAYLAYILTVYPTVTTEDSGEFISAVYHLGIAHPPGYPLYIVLAKIFTLLIPFGNVGWKVNLFSAFCGALTVGVFYLLIKILTNNRLVSLFTSFAAAASTIVWMQNIRAEVYTLNSFFLVVILILALRYYAETQEKKYDLGKKTLCWISLLLGLSFTNHPLMYLLGPPLVIFALVIRWKIVLDYKLVVKCILLFALGFSFNFFIPIRASYNPEINWNNPAGWNQMWEHITRDFYAKNAIVEKNLYAVEPPAPGFFTRFIHYDLINYSWRLFSELSKDFTPLIAIFFILGWIYAWIRDKKIFVLLTALFFFYGFYFGDLISAGNLDKLYYILWDDLAFFTPIVLVCLILSALGYLFLEQKIGRWKPAIKRYLSLSLLAISLLYLFIKVPYISQSGNYLVYDVVKTAFNCLPQSTALLLEGGDNTIFPLLYIQKVEGTRPDVKIYITAPINLFNLAQSYEKIIGDNPGKPIYTDYPFRDRAYSYDGLFQQLSLDNTRNFPNRVIVNKPGDQIRGIGASNLDHFNRYVAADYYTKLGMSLSAEPAKQNEYFAQAMAIAPNSHNLIAKYISNYLGMMGRFSEAIPYLEETVKYMPNDYNAVFQLILSYTIINRQDQALDYYNKLNQETKASMKTYWQNIAVTNNYAGLKEFLAKIANT